MHIFLIHLVFLSYFSEDLCSGFATAPFLDDNSWNSTKGLSSSSSHIDVGTVINVSKSSSIIRDSPTSKVVALTKAAVNTTTVSKFKFFIYFNHLIKFLSLRYQEEI